MKDETPITVTLPAGAVASLDLMVKHGIVGETRPEVARYFLIRALDDYRRSERSAKP